MNWLWFSLVIIVCYLIGNVNFARVIARVFKHEDITTKGSGNPGMMNMLRNYGIGYALLTLLLESIKAGVPALVCGYIFASQGLFEVAFFTAGFSVVLGHNFPVFYKFKGGKGIAATAGVVFSTFDWRIILTCLVLFTIVVAVTRYVSLGSLVMVTTFITMWIIFGQLGTDVGHLTGAALYESYILVGIFVLLAYIRHKDNIVRLVNGKENKLGHKKEEASDGKN